MTGKTDYEAYSIGLVCVGDSEVFIPVDSIKIAELERKVKQLAELGCSKVRLVVDIYIQKTLMEWDVNGGG